MTSRKELKQIAKTSLKGHWKFSIALTLLTSFLPMVILPVPLLGVLILTLLTPAIIYIPQELFIKIKRNEDVKINDVFSLLVSKLEIYWGLTIRILLHLLPCLSLMLIGSFVLVLGRIIAIPIDSPITTVISITGTLLNLLASVVIFINSLYYVLSIYIKIDNPEMTCNEAVAKSKELMNGHRLEYFLLTLSFIGWAFVSLITAGLGSLYLLPYIYTTFVAYYDNLIAK